MTETRPASPRTPWLELAFIFLGSRLLIALVCALSLTLLAKGEFFRGEASFASVLTNWDGTWFKAIADDGYSYTKGEYSKVAFFPFYPLLTGLAGFIPGGTLISGFLISNLALFGSLVLLWKLVEGEAAEGDSPLQPGDGSRAARLLAFGPVSFFFSLLYSESTFLFLILASIYAARRRCWPIAGIAGFAAALTRNAGVLLALPLLMEYFQIRWRAPFFQRPTSWLRAAWCFLPVGGLGAWALYLHFKFHNGWLFLEVQRAWGRKLNWPWVPFERDMLHNFPVFHQWWFVGHALTAVLLMLVGIALRLRPSILALGTCMLLLNLSANHLEAIPRLLSVIFPLYIAGAWLLRRSSTAESSIIAFSAGLLALSAVLFANGYWFT